jgi:hypothetical protein
MIGYLEFNLFDLSYAEVVKVLLSHGEADMEHTFGGWTRSPVLPHQDTSVLFFYYL